MITLDSDSGHECWWRCCKLAGSEVGHGNSSNNYNWLRYLGVVDSDYVSSSASSLCRCKWAAASLASDDEHSNNNRSNNNNTSSSSSNWRRGEEEEEEDIVATTTTTPKNRSTVAKKFVVHLRCFGFSLSLPLLSPFPSLPLSFSACSCGSAAAASLEHLHNLIQFNLATK